MDVAAWPARLGKLEQYAPGFHDNDVLSGEVLFRS